MGSFISQELVTVETAPGGLFDRKQIRPGAAADFHANEYLRLNVEQLGGNLESSLHRRARFESMAKPTTISEMLHVLGDTEDLQFPIFRRNDTTQEDTLFSVEFDLRRGAVAVFRDNPKDRANMLWDEHTSVPFK